VLLVDAHDDSRSIYTTILRHAGFVVHATACPDEGLSTARLTPPDVIVLALTPPRSRAVDLVRGFRGDPATARVPLLALSSIPTAEERDRLLAEGLTSYLHKPCTPLALLAEVRRLLEMNG
jgi:DNA-binding response OmpR family regulator